MLGIGADRHLPTVLLIDDDIISREVIATILTLNGYMLHTAQDGKAALAMLDENQCVAQVILVDVQMPGLNGIDLVKELRSRSQACIYAISGSSLPSDLEQVVDGFLQKPFNPDGLQKLLDADKDPSATPDVSTEEPVVSAKILSQFRQMMTEPTVREIYSAVVSDLKKRRRCAGQRDCQEGRGRSPPHRARDQGRMRYGRGPPGSAPGSFAGVESDQLDNSAGLRLELKAAQENLERMLEMEFPR